MRHVGHNSLYMVGILTYKVDITGHVTKRNERKMNGKKPQNLAMALGLSFGKFITGYETCFLKRFIAPEQISMSFAFTYIKCQAKQFSALWDLLLFFPFVFLTFSVSRSRLNFIGTMS